MRNEQTRLTEKRNEALKAVLPVVAIVLLLCFSIAPISSSILLCFLTGAVMVIAGMMFFTLGAEVAMTSMGELVGSSLSKCKNLLVLGLLTFILGFIITISEPDLQVLAQQVPSVPNMTLILFVACGVGIFLVIALLRMLIGISLGRMLTVFYAIVFVLAFFVPDQFLGVAFDSGGVTTGPMTVPFIMALGVGVSAIRGDRHAADDSFGLVALCSIGPILSTLLLSLLFHADSSSYEPAAIPEIQNSVELGRLFYEELPEYMMEIAVSLLPIIVFFALFQIAVLKLNGRTLIRIGVGMIYTYVGLVLFLTGANVGFMPAGSYLGTVIAGLDYRWIIVPIGMVIGFFIVRAEPAVYVLNKQVEELTDGAIPASAMGASLSIAIAVSVGLALLRVLAGIPVLYFLIPGYLLALLLTLVVPKIFTAIAFDSGGVASGPMTATFLLPFAQGACIAVGGDIVKDAFGVVAMVAMTPLITIQVLGVIYQIRSRKAAKLAPVPEPVISLDMLDDDAIIEL